MCFSKKVYQKDRLFMLNLINDLAELQKGKFTVSDAEHGRLGFIVEMYGQKYEYLFDVYAQTDDRTLVRIETKPPDQSAEERIKRMFLLMDGYL